MSGRRGACPTLLEPMQTGDGLLARLNPVGGALNGRQIAGLAQAAKRFGNGIVEITARGSLQIRGLTAESTGGLAAEVDALGVAVRYGLSVETNPLAGFDSEEVADPRDLAREIGKRAEALDLSSRLGPKVSVTVDGGGVLGLGGLLADVKLEAVYALSEEAASHGAKGRGTSQGNPVTWLLRVGGSSSTARVLGRFSGADAAEIAIRVLQALAERGRTARARDLSDADLATITNLEPSPAGAYANPPRSPVGRFALANGKHARGFALPYGQIESQALARFANSVGGDREIRLAPGRGLLVCDVPHEEDAPLMATAERSGLVTSAADLRLAIAACAGSPACASAYLATRRLADRLVARRPDLATGLRIHLSGCAKQCARPVGPVVTLLGGEDGYRIVNDGASVPRDLRALLKELADEDLASMQGQTR